MTANGYRDEIKLVMIPCQSLSNSLISRIISDHICIVSDNY
jgi:hypothetical protein